MKMTSMTRWNSIELLQNSAPPDRFRAEGEEINQGRGGAPSGFARGAGREWPSPFESEMEVQP